MNIEKVPFDAWPFGDGGSLDNSPFTQSTSELSQRRAEVPVRRTMFYVEPDPAKSAGNVEGGRPDAVQNLLKQGVLLPELVKWAETTESGAVAGGRA